MLAGCLFPSFDDLRKNPAASSGDDAALSNEPDSGTSSSSSTPSKGPSAPVSNDDAGSTKSIECGGITCHGEQVCCKDFIDDPECKPAAGKHDFDTVLFCDDASDCGPGQACCQKGTGSGDSVCRTGGCGSNEYTYCTTDAECPVNTKCTGNAGAGALVPLKNCQ